MSTQIISIENISSSPPSPSTLSTPSIPTPSKTSPLASNFLRAATTAVTFLERLEGLENFSKDNLKEICYALQISAEETRKELLQRIKKIL